MQLLQRLGIDVNFFLVTLLTYSLKFDIGRFFLLLLFNNHSGWRINRAARFLWLALANHKDRLERPVFLIVKHIKLVFVFLHVLFYHGLEIRLFFAPLIFQKWGLQLKVLELLLLNVPRSLEVLLGLRDVHASLLWKFVAAERMSPVQCGLWWTLSGVWVLLLENGLLPILFVAFLRLYWQLSWLFRAPLRHHAFEIRGITKNVNKNKKTYRGAGEEMST